MILIIILFGLVLRLISLNQSLWIDEATSIFVARNFSFIEILTKFSPGDFHPPLFYWLLKTWIGLFGSNEVEARTLSVSAGLLSILFIYLVGKEIKDKRLGLIAAALLATSPLFVYYSQEVRMYALSVLFALISVFSLMKTLTRDRVGYWLLFSVSLALSALTDYLPILILPAFWIYGIISKPSKSWWKKFIASHIILVFLLLLWLPVLTQQLQAGLNVEATSPSWWNVLGPASLKNLVLIPVKFMIGRISFDDKVLYGLIVGVFSVLLAYPLYISIKKAKDLRLFWVWLLIPIFLSFVISLKIAVFSYFRLIFVLPAFYLVVAYGISELKTNFRQVLLAGIIFLNIFASIYYLFNPKFYREDWRSLVSFIETSKKADSITLFPANSQMEAYKYYSSDAKIAGPEGFNKTYKEIWLMRYVQPIFDPEDRLKSTIEKNGYQKVQEDDFNGVVVWRYQK